MGLGVLACLALACPGCSSRTGAQEASGRVGQDVYSVHASVDEVSLGYIRWAALRSKNKRAKVMLTLPMPSIDLYSPDGLSLYHGANSDENAAFIRALPRSIPHSSTAGTRPTLKEAVAMFTELKPYEAKILRRRGYTLFALSYKGADFCRAQNDAIASLEKARAARVGIAVVQVWLHR